MSANENEENLINDGVDWPCCLKCKFYIQKSVKVENMIHVGQCRRLPPVVVADVREVNVMQAPIWEPERMLCGEFVEWHGKKVWGDPGKIVHGHDGWVRVKKQENIINKEDIWSGIENPKNIGGEDEAT